MIKEHIIESKAIATTQTCRKNRIRQQLDCFEIASTLAN